MLSALKLRSRLSQTMTPKVPSRPASPRALIMAGWLNTGHNARKECDWGCQFNWDLGRKKKGQRMDLTMHDRPCTSTSAYSLTDIAREARQTNFHRDTLFTRLLYSVKLSKAEECLLQLRNYRTHQKPFLYRDTGKWLPFCPANRLDSPASSSYLSSFFWYFDMKCNSFKWEACLSLGGSLRSPGFITWFEVVSEVCCYL